MRTASRCTGLNQAPFITDHHLLGGGPARLVLAWLTHVSEVSWSRRAPRGCLVVHQLMPRPLESHPRAVGDLGGRGGLLAEPVNETCSKA